MAKSKKVTHTRWSNATTPIDSLSPTELLAHEIVCEFGDLAPSVERIMAAELEDDDRHRALTWFRDSLGHIGDPNRDPRVAIANAAGSSS